MSYWIEYKKKHHYRIYNLICDSAFIIQDGIFDKSLMGFKNNKLSIVFRNGSKKSQVSLNILLVLFFLYLFIQQASKC